MTWRTAHVHCQDSDKDMCVRVTTAGQTVRRVPKIITVTLH